MFEGKELASRVGTSIASQKIFHGDHSTHGVFPFLHFLTSAELLLTKPLGPKEIRFLMLIGTKNQNPIF
jgi:hypothetical protein